MALYFTNSHSKRRQATQSFSSPARDMIPDPFSNLTWNLRQFVLESSFSHCSSIRQAGEDVAFEKGGLRDELVD